MGQLNGIQIVGKALGEGLHDFTRPISTAIIDQHDLLAERYLCHSLHQIDQGCLLVIHGDHDRQQEVGRNLVEAQLATGRVAEGLPQSGIPFGGVGSLLRCKYGGKAIGPGDGSQGSYFIAARGPVT